MTVEQRLLDPVLNADQILPIVILSGHQLSQPEIAVLSATGQLLPFGHSSTHLQDQSRLVSRLLCLRIHMNYQCITQHTTQV